MRILETDHFISINKSLKVKIKINSKQTYSFPSFTTTSNGATVHHDLTHHHELHHHQDPLHHHDLHTAAELHHAAAHVDLHPVTTTTSHHHHVDLHPITATAHHVDVHHEPHLLDFHTHATTTHAHPVHLQTELHHQDVVQEHGDHVHHAHRDVVVATPHASGFWKKSYVWKPRWVKSWQEKKVYVAVWKHVWGPVQVSEWVPIPKPPPGWTKH